MKSVSKKMPPHKTGKKLALLLLSFVTLAIYNNAIGQITYYYDGSGNLNSTSNWGRNTDGSGTSPSNFTSNDQIFELRNATAISSTKNWTVSGTNSKIVLGNPSVSAITLSHSNGDIEGVLDIASASSGSNTYSVSVTVDSKVATLGTLSNGSTVDFCRGGSQSVQTATYYNLTLSASGTKTATGEITVNGTLTVNSGVILDLAMMSLSGTFTNSGTGTVRTQGTAISLPTDKTWTCDVEYNSSSAQPVASGIYGNLNCTGGNRTLSNSGTISISGTFTKGTGVYTVTGSTMSFNGAAQSIPAFTFNNLTIAGSGNKTAAGAIIVNGILTINDGLDLDMTTFTLGGITSTSGTGNLKTQNTSAVPVPSGKTWTCNVKYNSASAQNMVPGVFSNIDATGGNRVLPNGGTVSITASFVPGSGSITSTGSTIDFSGNSLQTIPTPLILNNMTINNNNGVSLDQNVTINGTLNFTAGKLNINGKTLTITGSISGTTNFTGSATSNLVVSGSGSMGADINMDQTSSSTRSLNNLSIDRTSSTINLGANVELVGTLTLTNGTLSSGGYLTLISNATTTARIAAISGTGDITGSVSVQRYVPAVMRRYRMLSPGTSSFTFADLIDDIFITGTGGVTNGFDAGSTSTTVFTYQESTTGGRGWKAIPSISAPLSPGSGALVFLRGDRTLPSPAWYTQNMSAYPASQGFPPQNAVTIDFNGTINKGTITPVISYTNTGDPSADGWNLVGNPYASQIDWTMLTKSNLSSFYYTYDPSSGSYVANNGSNMIAPGQAFFVQAIGASPALSFTESSKSTTAPTNYFKSGSQIIEMRMIKDATNSDIAWMEFKNGASRLFNTSEDAAKIANSAVNVAWLVDTSNIKLQYSTVPPLTQSSDSFPIFVSGSAGDYQLTFSGVQNIVTGQNIYLRDAFQNTLINLRTTSTYGFTITSNDASFGNNRFQILISGITSLPVKLIDFKASKALNDKDVELKWSTGSEQNSEMFLIERSVNSVSGFNEIDSIKAAGNSSGLLTYSFDDKNILSEQKSNAIIYYRLKEREVDGMVMYSNIVSVEVKNNKPADLVIFPNPAADYIQIRPNVSITGNVNYEIYDLSGRLILSGNANGADTRIAVSNLITGIYIVKLSGPSITSSIAAKFTKIEARGPKKKSKKK